MKQTIIFLFLLLNLKGFSQDYLDKITQQTCGCLNKVSDTVSTDRMYMELGVCMISAAEPYKKQLKKDHNIDISNIDSNEEGEKLGKLIGIKMASVCPDALLALTARAEKNEKNNESDLNVFVGRITKIDKDYFVVFTITDTENKSL